MNKDRHTKVIQCRQKMYKLAKWKNWWTRKTGKCDYRNDETGKKEFKEPRMILRTLGKCNSLCSFFGGSISFVDKKSDKTFFFLCNNHCSLYLVTWAMWLYWPFGITLLGKREILLTSNFTNNDFYWYRLESISQARANDHDFPTIGCCNRAYKVIQIFTLNHIALDNLNIDK